MFQSVRNSNTQPIVANFGIETIKKDSLTRNYVINVSVFLQKENPLFSFDADMDLSVRALNCLKAADVETLGDLVQFNKTDLLKFRNFGKKSLTELDDLLESLNLSFGTDISKYKLDKE